MTSPSADDASRPHLAASNVALVLAAGMVLALNVITVALLVAAFQLTEPELSANGTQLLTGWGGGIIGVLGSYIGFTFGQRARATEPAEPEQPQSIKGPRP